MNNEKNRQEKRSSIDLEENRSASIDLEENRSASIDPEEKDVSSIDLEEHRPSPVLHSLGSDQEPQTLKPSLVTSDYPEESSKIQEEDAFTQYEVPLTVKWCTATTPLQIGLLLLNLVAVPFLISMVVVYAINTLAPRAELCADLCKSLTKVIEVKTDDRFEAPKIGGIPHFRDNIFSHRAGADDFRLTDAFGPIDGVGRAVRRRRSIPKKSHCKTLPKLSQYPPIAALVENLHRDDDSTKVYKCMAVAISKNFALTSSLCLRDFQKGFELQIRLKSDFWSKNGTLLKIEKFSWIPRDDGFFALEKPFLAVVRFESSENWCLKDNFRFPGKSAGDFGFAFTWQSDLDASLKKRKKFAPLSRFGVVLKKIGIGDFLVGVSERSECFNDFGGPLLGPDGRSMLGVHLYTECSDEKAVYYYADLRKYERFLQSVLM